MAQLGHQKLETTQIYAAAVSERRRATVMALPFGSLTKVQATHANVEGFKPYRIPRVSNVWIKG